jgi:hypothetical protein
MLRRHFAHTPQETPARKLLGLAGLVVVATVLVAPAASADTRPCYTLGVPGFDHYEYCTQLPVDPNDILR